MYHTDIIFFPEGTGARDDAPRRAARRPPRDVLFFCLIDRRRQTVGSIDRRRVAAGCPLLGCVSSHTNDREEYETGRPVKMATKTNTSSERDEQPILIDGEKRRHRSQTGRK